MEATRTSICLSKDFTLFYCLIDQFSSFILYIYFLYFLFPVIFFLFIYYYDESVDLFGKKGITLIDVF